jgi:AraC-like DNA-binding protein
MTTTKCFYPEPYSEIGSSGVKRGLIINSAGLSLLQRPFITRATRRDFSLYYVFKGNMTVVLEDVNVNMCAGQAILYFPHTPFHHFLTESGAVDVFWIHFTGYESPNLIESYNIPNRTLITIMPEDGLLDDIRTMMGEFITYSSRQTYLATANLITIIAKIGSMIPDIPANASRGTKRVYHALSYIHGNFSQELSIEKLAALEHLSPSHFRVVFKASTGQSPQNYLTSLRISHACRLITHENLSIAQAASAVGYNDPHYFSRIFKAQIGCVPSEYKRRNTGWLTDQSPHP